MKFYVGGALFFLATLVGTANAATIPGPLLDLGASFTVTGLGFTANDNSRLVGFTYQNQGAADTVVLTNSAGTILDSISTPAGTPSYTASVNWSLTSGNKYWLLQTGGANDLFASYGLPLPSNADISITQSGTFFTSIAGALSNVEGWGSNQYWAAFNSITTSTSATPLPSTWTMLIAGFVGLGFFAYRGSKKNSAALATA